MLMSSPDNPTNRPDISLLRISPEDKEKRPTGKWTVGVLFVVVLVFAAGAVYHFVTNRGPVITVAIAEQIANGSEKTILNASGYVTPRRRATISAKITGQITELKVDEGAHVKKGDILARFDDSNIRAMIRTLESEVITSEASISEITVNMKNAERNYLRNKNLSKSCDITVKDLDDSKTQFDSIGARLGVARKQLDVSRNRLAEMKQELVNYTVTAPFPGIVVSKDAQVGEKIGRAHV
jgi:multidrug efflux pump subunit AcrA (membrane-fusion protein)